MNPNEQTGPSEYETMDTLTLLRLHHKAATELNSIREADLHTHQREEVAIAGENWDKQIKIMGDTKKALETRGTKFTDRGIDLRHSSQEIQDLIKNNRPE